MRTAIYLVLISLYICSCGDGQPQAQQSFSEGPVVAIVNTDTVRSHFFEKAYIEHLINTGANDTRENRYRFLQKLRDELLLAQQAQEFNVLDEAFFDYKDQVRRLSIADRFYSSSFLDTLSLPTEEQIQAAFYNSKIKLHVSHLFFTNQEKAHQAYQRLEDGEKFLDLANEIYHLSKYDSTAGYIGEISYFNVDDAFGEAAYQLKAGEYSEPVRSRQGYHIIYVDHRIGNPLITQSEFEYKKRGITGLTKNRIKNLKGDAFVQTYMQSLDVKVDQEAIQQLFMALQNLKPQQTNNPLNRSDQIQSYPSTSEVQSVREDLTPGTILASYQHLGEEKYFTAENYADWLKTIPMEEARTRTMASVGRALRNQVFYEAGMEQNIGEDPIVANNVEYKTTFYKAYRVKEYLANQPVPEISEEEQREAFEGLGMNTITNKRFTGWIINAGDIAGAKRIKERIQEGERTPASFDGYKQYQNEKAETFGTLSSHIFRAPMGAPVIVGSNDTFFVLYVEDREQKETSFEEAREELLAEMKRYYNVVNKLKQLRASSTTKVDTASFEKLMDHMDDPALRGNSKYLWQ
ncbi:peptidylprolyl isomerase [Gracilimonas mengyeensis]|uniref:PPIC-type PPIASE domain-containing protein n=1 Tax=Gracilimonas mengyeensis TaxID=1302730 RepID=A0A521EZQ6_9BACT|nr:peptidyl-prolyl cis-trans isomerase [Gracilimonas mengyeensis]SMO88660.1 PPIC-type PPIASE domain-containing protein [Gracilimonas mengyeensis]